MAGDIENLLTRYLKKNQKNSVFSSSKNRLVMSGEAAGYIYRSRCFVLRLSVVIRCRLIQRAPNDCQRHVGKLSNGRYVIF